jgi:hypothetical protein
MVAVALGLAFDAKTVRERAVRFIETGAVRFSTTSNTLRGWRLPRRLPRLMSWSQS